VHLVRSFAPRRHPRPSLSPSSSNRVASNAGNGAQLGTSPTTVPTPRLSPLTPEVADAILASPFTSLKLAAPIVRALIDDAYAQPTPIQTEVIPHLLDGRDVLACAQTGTGKTAAFVLPILQHLAMQPSPSRRVRALVLTPTRELAAQIAERVSAYGRYLGIRNVVVYGGVSQQRQEIALRNAPDVLIATPGRLLDLMNQRVVDLSGITHFVLDEADRMLDMGFVHDVRRVVQAIPKQRQTLLFSATMPAAIEALAQNLLINPVRVAVKPAVTTAEGVAQSVMFVAKADKKAALERVLLKGDVERAIVFTRTKHGANRLSEQLEKSGIQSAAIHGNKSQGARDRALAGFRAGTTRVLVATDIAARGIDVDGISHVINFELPNIPESYVHRIGRTGRAGAVGQAISLCDREERGFLADIERLIRKRLPVVGSEGQIEMANAAPLEPAPRERTSAPALDPSRRRRFRGGPRR
jgi:ATP-dependent RNA helicase RhlE